MMGGQKEDNGPTLEGLAQQLEALERENGKRLEALESKNERLERENERMRSKNAELRHKVATLEGSGTTRRVGTRRGEVAALRGTLRAGGPRRSPTGR